MKKMILFMLIFVSVFLYSQNIDKRFFVKDYILIGISSDEKKFYNILDRVLTKQKSEEIKRKINTEITKEIKMSISELKKRIKISSEFFYVGINSQNENKFFIIIPTENPKESINAILTFMKRDPKTKIKVETIDNIGVVKKNNVTEMTYLIEDSNIVLAPRSEILKDYIDNKKEPDNLVTEVTNNTAVFFYIDEMEKTLSIEKPIMIRVEYTPDIRIIARSTQKNSIKPIPIKIESPILYIVLPVDEKIKNVIFSEADPNLTEAKDLIGDQVFLIVNNFDYQSIVNGSYNSLDFVLGIKVNNVGKTTEFLMKNSQGMLQPANKPYPSFNLFLPGIALNLSIQKDYLLVSTKEFGLSEFISKNFLFIDLQRLFNKIPPLKSKIVEFGLSNKITTVEGYIEDKKEYQDSIVVIK